MWKASRNRRQPKPANPEPATLGSGRQQKTTLPKAIHRPTWPLLVAGILTGLLLILAACAAADQEHTPATPPASGLPLQFWDCILTEKHRWVHGSPWHRRFDSEVSTALAAARRCAESHRPPWPPEKLPPAEGAAIRACLDRERDRFLAWYPEWKKLADGDNFFLQGLNQICYLTERTPKFRFKNAETPSGK